MIALMVRVAMTIVQQQTKKMMALANRAAAAATRFALDDGSCDANSSVKNNDSA